MIMKQINLFLIFTVFDYKYINKHINTTFNRKLKTRFLRKNIKLKVNAFIIKIFCTW